MTSYQREYGNAIWTNHAIDRLSQRRLPQDMARQALDNPDRVIPGKKYGTKEHQKRIGKYRITLITSHTERHEVLVLSCWVDPPFSGSIDIEKQAAYRTYKKASFWGRLWINLKSIVGL